ncbi:MarR family transcriptional regulator [bacterium]|nr:MarR family transcriptional regulator [bacterium]
MQRRNLMAGESVAHLVGKVRRAFTNHLNRSYVQAGLNINVQQFVVLVILWNKDRLPQQDIASLTGKDKTSVTRLLNNMEKKGLILRQHGNTDKRQKLICLTEKGKSLKEKLIIHTEININTAEKDISSEDMEICKNVLNKMYENLTSKA